MTLCSQGLCLEVVRRLYTEIPERFSQICCMPSFWKSMASEKWIRSSTTWSMDWLFMYKKSKRRSLKMTCSKTEMILNCFYHTWTRWHGSDEGEISWRVLCLQVLLHLVGNGKWDWTTYSMTDGRNYPASFPAETLQSCLTNAVLWTYTWLSMRIIGIDQSSMMYDELLRAPWTMVPAISCLKTVPAFRMCPSRIYRTSSTDKSNRITSGRKQISGISNTVRVYCLMYPIDFKTSSADWKSFSDGSSLGEVPSKIVDGDALLMINRGAMISTQDIGSWTFFLLWPSSFKVRVTKGFSSRGLKRKFLSPDGFEQLVISCAKTIQISVTLPKGRWNLGTRLYLVAKWAEIWFFSYSVYTICSYPSVTTVTTYRLDTQCGHCIFLTRQIHRSASSSNVNHFIRMLPLH